MKEILSMALYCPYCDIEINEKQLEAEDGCCPECGAFISASTVVAEGEDDDEFGDEFGDEDETGVDDDMMDLGDDNGGDREDGSDEDDY